jgi:hypothetical protein
VNRAIPSAHGGAARGGTGGGAGQGGAREDGLTRVSGGETTVELRYNRIGAGPHTHSYVVITHPYQEISGHAQNFAGAEYSVLAVGLLTLRIRG